MNLTIRALCREGRLKEAIHILLTANTQSPSHLVEFSTCLQLLETCIAEKALLEGKLVHSYINTMGFTFKHDFLQNKLIHMYVNCGSLADARKVFDCMTVRDVFSWNMIISAYQRHGFHRDALALFHQMQQTGPGIQPNQFTFPSIVQACAEVADLKQGLQIHQRLFKSGFLSEVVVMSSLLGMYVKCGRIHKARKLFDKMSQRCTVLWTVMVVGYAQIGLLKKARELFDQMPQRDTVSWTAMIAGYAQNGLFEKALGIFKQMQMTGVKPSSATFASILPACAKMGVLDEGMDIHQSIVENGFSSDVVVANALIDMYAKCRKTHKARELFDNMENANTVSWNAMIAGYAQNGLIEKARELFDQMPHQNVVSWNAMITGYAQNGLAEKAREVFDKMPQRGAVSWNAMIAGYAQNGLLEKALEIFRQMQVAGVKPSSATFASILPACAKMGGLVEGMDIHQSIVENGFSSDVVVVNALIDLYAKCGAIQKAHELFDKMCNADTVSWTAMITGYAQNGFVEKARELFDQMPHQNIVSWNAMITGYAQNGLVGKAHELFDKMPHQDAVSWTAMISGYAQNGHVEKARKLFDKMPHPDAISWTAMIAGYAQNGLVEKTYELFDKMPHRDAFSWSAMIAGYAQNGLLDNALKIFNQMQLAGVKPSSATFTSILTTCAKMGALEQGMDIHQRIIESGFSKDVVVVNALIDMYAKCGSIPKARELFDKIHNANTVSWTAMIGGYAMHGYSKDALKLFELMKHSRTNPNHVCFICVLFACSHAGLVDEGCKYFNSMTDSYCIIPTMDHYVCIVDLLARAGYLEEALNFIAKMPMKPEVVVWMCLLGACRSHKNIGIGEFVGTILFVSDHKNAASYVLLSNIYAEVGRWDDVQRLRKLVKDRGIKKTPGSSWIEVHKMVHAFCVGG